MPIWAALIGALVLLAVTLSTWARRRFDVARPGLHAMPTADIEDPKRYFFWRTKDIIGIAIIDRGVR